MRKIIQIATYPNVGIFCVTDDGLFWQLVDRDIQGEFKWVLRERIPQDDVSALVQEIVTKKILNEAGLE